MNRRLPRYLLLALGLALVSMQASGYYAYATVLAADEGGILGFASMDLDYGDTYWGAYGAGVDASVRKGSTQLAEASDFQQNFDIPNYGHAQTYIFANYTGPGEYDLRGIFYEGFLYCEACSSLSWYPVGSSDDVRHVGGAAPIISSINPEWALRGSSGSITINGSYLVFNDQTTVDLDGTALQISSAAAPVVVVQFSSLAEGDHTLTVTTAEGSSSYPFTGADPTPVISDISPSTWYAGTSTTVTITGTGFGTSPSVDMNASGVSKSIQSASDTQITMLVSVDPAAPDQTNVTVTVTSNGYGGGQFFYQPQQSGGNSGTLVAQVRRITVSLSPSIRTLSTGDTDKTVTTTLNPSAQTFTPTLSGNFSSAGNPNSSCGVTLHFSGNSGSGSVDTTVTADPAGCSGTFQGYAVTPYGVSNTIQVVVPPQILIQMMYGEAHGQTSIGDDMSQLAIGQAVKNRFSQTALFSGVTTYQQAITPQQFNGIATNIQNGPQHELANAAAVFTGATAGIVASAACFFSPTATGWTAIQPALQSHTLTLPNVSFDPQCYGGQRQFVYKQSVGMNADNRGAPAFIFLQQRDASTDPAVVQIN